MKLGLAAVLIATIACAAPTGQVTPSSATLTTTATRSPAAASASVQPPSGTISAAVCSTGAPAQTPRGTAALPPAAGATAGDIAQTAARLLEQAVFVKTVFGRTTTAPGRATVMSTVISRYHFGCASHGTSTGAGIYLEHIRLKGRDASSSSTYTRTSPTGEWQRNPLGSAPTAADAFSNLPFSEFQQHARNAPDVDCAAGRCWAIVADWRTVPQGQVSATMVIAKGSGLPMQWRWTERPSDGSVSDVILEFTDHGVPLEIRAPV